MPIIDNPRIEYHAIDHHADGEMHKELKFFFFDEEFSMNKSFGKKEEAIPIAKKFVRRFKNDKDKLQPALDDLIKRLTS